MKKEVIARLIEENYETLKNRDLHELAGKLSANISQLIASTPNGFQRWALYQASIDIMAPHPTETIFAANNGRIYINPAFWNAIIDLAENTNSDHTVEQRFAILHEVAHLVFKHPWEFNGLVDDTFLENHGIHRDAAQYLANACMDYIVNNFCLEILPEVEAARNLLVATPFDLQQVVTLIGAKFPWALTEKLENIHYSRFSWKDLFLEIVAANPGFSASPEASRFTGSSMLDWSGTDTTEGLGSPDEAPQVEPGGPGEESIPEEPPPEVQGVHGQKPHGRTVVVRRGAGQPDLTPEETWDRVQKIAVAEARREKEVGTSPAGYLLALEKACEIRIPWETLVKRELVSSLNTSKVIASWSRPSRKLDDYPGTICPGGGQDLWILADTSGSMLDELEMITGVAVSYFRHNLSPGSVKIIPWDATAYDEIAIRTPTDLEKLRYLPGGGGTVILPALKKVLSKVDEGHLVVVCTDSVIADIGGSDFREKLLQIHLKTGNDILWLNLGNPDDVEILVSLPGVKVLHRCNCAITPYPSA